MWGKRFHPFVIKRWSLLVSCAFYWGPLEEITVCLVFSSSLSFLSGVKNEQKPWNGEEKNLEINLLKQKLQSTFRRMEYLSGCQCCGRLCTTLNCSSVGVVFELFKLGHLFVKVGSEIGAAELSLMLYWYPRLVFVIVLALADRLSGIGGGVRCPRPIMLNVLGQPPLCKSSACISMGLRHRCSIYTWFLCPKVSN